MYSTHPDQCPSCLAFGTEPCADDCSAQTLPDKKALLTKKTSKEEVIWATVYGAAWVKFRLYQGNGAFSDKVYSTRTATDRVAKMAADEADKAVKAFQSLKAKD